MEISFVPEMEEMKVQFSDESSNGLPAPSTVANGPVTIYRLIKLEHAEALGISLREGSVTTPNQSTKIITRNIINLRRPPKKMVLAQKNPGPGSLSTTITTRPMYGEQRDNNFYEPYIVEEPDVDNGTRFSCKLCNKSFRHVSHLKRHINSHTGEKLYDCDTCGKKFLDASTLCRHRKTHTGERPYACKVCEKNFGTIGSLRRHVTVHNQESRPYSCTVCSKRFPDNSSLQKHRSIHTGVKPYACDLCNKAFTHVGDLNGHKKVHEKVKPWKCPRCDKRFAKQSNCARHELIHEGDKEFVCHHCGVGYNFQSSLTRHLLTHRKKGNTRQSGNKVIVLTEIDGQDYQSSKKQGSRKYAMTQVKRLLGRQNKLTFSSSAGEVEIIEVGSTSGDVESENEESAENEEHSESSTENKSNTDRSSEAETIIPN